MTRPTRVLLHCLLAAALLLAGLRAFGQADDGVPWTALTPAQRGVLSSLQRDWDTISPSRQQKWIAIADRYPKLPAEEQQRLQRRMTNWAQMTPAERDRARRNYQEARRIGGDDRKARWEAYQALSSDRKRELAHEVDPAAPARRPSARAAAGDGVKSNIVQPPRAELPARRVAPTVLQARPGATTNLLSQPARPPLHQQAGLPKIAATPGFVEPNTLLPQRGAQGAAAQPSRPASAPSRRR